MSGVYALYLRDADTLKGPFCATVLCPDKIFHLRDLLQPDPKAISLNLEGTPHGHFMFPASTKLKVIAQVL